jgi:hypothetical protein
MFSPERAHGEVLDHIEDENGQLNLAISRRQAAAEKSFSSLGSRTV